MEGSDYSLAEGNQHVMPSGDNLQFTPNFPPGSGNLLDTSYAVFGFHQSQYLVAPDLHLEWITAPAAADLWIGYSDYSTNRWTWMQATDSVTDFPIADIAALSTPAPDCNFYVALLLTGEGQSVLDWLRVGKILPNDAILAIPNKTSVSVGETVTVTVYTNRSASPFQFCESVRVVIPESCSMAPGSFNIGEEGGTQLEADGIWAQMPVTDFIYLGDGIIEMRVDLGGGLVAHDFYVTPIAGIDLTDASGAMFNFGLVCNEDVTLSFAVSESDPKPTVYSEFSGDKHLWTDASNFGMPTIDVL